MKIKTQQEIQKDLFPELSTAIDLDQNKFMLQANTFFISLFWRIGKYIVENLDIDKPESIRQLSIQLTKKYGKIFEVKNLKYMAELARQFPDSKIIDKLRLLVSWAHLKQLLSLKKWEAQLFYATLAAREGLSVNALKKRINNQEFENANKIYESPKSKIKKFSGPPTKHYKLSKSEFIKEETWFIDYGPEDQNLCVNNIFKDDAFLYLLRLDLGVTSKNRKRSNNFK